MSWPGPPCVCLSWSSLLKRTSSDWVRATLTASFHLGHLFQGPVSRASHLRYWDEGFTTGVREGAQFSPSRGFHTLTSHSGASPHAVSALLSIICSGSPGPPPSQPPDRRRNSAGCIHLFLQLPFSGSSRSLPAIITAPESHPMPRERPVPRLQKLEPRPRGLWGNRSPGMHPSPCSLPKPRGFPRRDARAPQPTSDASQTPGQSWRCLCLGSWA